jgi:hypothetical protein
MEHIAGDNQVMDRSRQSIRTLFTIKTGMPDFPYNRAVFTVLDMKLFPFLPLKYAGIYQFCRVCNLSLSCTRCNRYIS